jgi:DNA-binding PadR family transcriptional regulator
MTQAPSRRPGKEPRKLTTISYAVLGLLRIRPHSAYELAQQNSRSGIFWSAAQSVVYEEAKKLAAQELATATTVTDGPRRRTVYAITEAGRRELHRWLSEPGGDPQVQYPDMLRVLFADAGTNDDLLAAISSIRGWARRSRYNAQRIALDYLGGQPPPYPGRTHIVKLTMAYQLSVVTAVERWADWAEAEARMWNDTVTPAEADLETFRRILQGWAPPQQPADSPSDASLQVITGWRPRLDACSRVGEQTGRGRRGHRAEPHPGSRRQGRIAQARRRLQVAEQDLLWCDLTQLAVRARPPVLPEGVTEERHSPGHGGLDVAGET